MKKEAYVTALMILMGNLGAAHAAISKVDVKPEQGSVQFLAVGKPAFLKIKGEAKGPVGAVEKKGENWGAEFQFDLGTLETGISLRDEHMKDKYLEVGKHPKAKLTIAKLDLPVDWTPVTALSKEMPFTGELEMHGVKKPVTGTAQLDSGASGASVSAKFQIAISDYQIGIPSYAGVTVADKVDVEVNLKNLK